MPVEGILVMERIMKIEVPASDSESFKLFIVDAFAALKVR